MGAGSSALAGATLPPTLDKVTAQQLAGDKFDESKFDAAAKDGAVSREAFLKAAGATLDEDGDIVVSTTSAPTHDARKQNEQMVAVALSLVHDKRSSFLWPDGGGSMF